MRNYIIGVGAGLCIGAIVSSMPTMAIIGLLIMAAALVIFE